MEKEKKGRAIALLPIGVFLIIFLGAGIVFKDFYAMPALVALLIAVFVACLRNKELRFFRCSYCSRWGRQYSQFRIVIDPGTFCSCRSVSDRMFYFGFYGNFHGNDCSTCTDRSWNQ